jgi:hypothetical protein
MRDYGDSLFEDLKKLRIRGCEGEEDSGEKSEDTSETEDEESSESEEQSSNTDGLKSALQKERRERRALAKEIKALREFRQSHEDSVKDDVTKAKDQADQATSKAEKLAKSLRDRTLDNAIIKLATSMDFVDVDDALSLIDRDLIDIEQDEDDPSEVSVDESTVQSALETLKKKKPHLIKGAQNGSSGGLTKSGSKVTGSGKATKEQTDDDALRARYPALQRGAPKS